MIEDILQVDINDVVSNNIKLKIKSLEDKITKLDSDNKKLHKQLKEQEVSINDYSISLDLLNYIRTEYSKIKKSDENEHGFYASKEKNQYLFISNILNNLFNIKEEYNGWITSRDYGSLATHLAVNYYSNKDIVIKLLKILNVNSNIISYISIFNMPFDYTKSEVIKYVNSPNYNTNGCIFGISQYWIESGASKTNMPHDLIMKNPHILEDDVFDLLLKTIYINGSNFYYLFALPKYNKNISDEQIEKLGMYLLSIPVKMLNYEEVETFIKNNILKFNNQTLDYLYKLIPNDNQYKCLHWENFPVEYQQKYLMSKSFDEIFKILNNYSCKWSIQQKEEFIRNWSKNTNNEQ